MHLGTQGWNYDAWVGPFYPPRTRAVEYLTVYARAFDTVEVDSTFYAVPAAKTVRQWAQRTPAHFTFSLKMPQEITHERRLRGCGDLTAEFLDRARELEGKLAVVLLQFGPDFGPAELPALAEFLPTLPNDIRFAVEFRQRGWIYDGVLALLSEHGVALTLADGKWIPRKQVLSLAERPTADFTYVRWLGSREIVDFSRVQVDRTRDLETWAGVLERLERDGRTIYGYFNNHFSGHSPASARDLQRLLHQTPVDPERIGEQMTLF
ncbi:MAG: DUF72 domain-containing protein [Gemmatimonadota bacterium]|nr:DUF72 domain-containing protein [Gemmatimonadota bacterium]